jgi:hypothetical protein
MTFLLLVDACLCFDGRLPLRRSLRSLAFVAASRLLWWFAAA